MACLVSSGVSLASLSPPSCLQIMLMNAELSSSYSASPVGIMGLRKARTRPYFVTALAGSPALNSWLPSSLRAWACRNCSRSVEGSLALEVPVGAVAIIVLIMVVVSNYSENSCVVGYVEFGLVASTILLSGL